MKVVVATDKFAGTMTAMEASRAIAEGWLDQRPHDEVRWVPMADGGPGTVAVVAAGTGGKLRTTATVDQRGEPVEAVWLDLGGTTAILEACSACGIDLVAPTERNPSTAHTRGVGLLLGRVATLGFDRIVVGLGGSGTVDGGLGAALGLGAEATASGGGPLSGAPLEHERLEAVTAIPPLTGAVVAATDVTNPLLGPEGAARVFGPQKGAGQGEVEALERGLAHLADVVEACLPGGPWRDLAGAGAAGGLGFGLMAWTGAVVQPGAALVADSIGLDHHVCWADVVVTGEGSLDRQTLAGKAPARVAASADEAGRPVLAVAGRVDDDVRSVFEAVETLGPEGLRDPVGMARRAGARLAVGISAGAGPGTR